MVTFAMFSRVPLVVNIDKHNESAVVTIWGTKSKSQTTDSVTPVSGLKWQSQLAGIHPVPLINRQGLPTLQDDSA